MKQQNRTSLEQEEVHAAIKQIYFDYEQVNDYEIDAKMSENKYYKAYEHLDKLEIHVKNHCDYAYNKLLSVGKSIMGLDVGQPWCIYWPLNTLSLLLNQDLPTLFNEPIIKFLSYCNNGGYGGGHCQYSQLAPTYSAILSLLIIGAYKEIDRKGLEQFFYSVQNPLEKGSYLMHVNGESDMRAVYIVVIFVILFKLDEKLLDGCAEYIAKCQTYEGGIGGGQFQEAHGGYTFCGYAALKCMGKTNYIDESRMLSWLAQRQMEGEGGFSGRTNKVVDSCYSFWQGAIFSLLEKREQMNSLELQKYITICQNPNGGIFDKPGKSADAYHTCYALSGYSLSKCNEMDSVYNIRKERVNEARDYFNSIQE